MCMGFAPTWLCQVTPPPASQNHFKLTTVSYQQHGAPKVKIWTSTSFTRHRVSRSSAVYK